MCACVCVCVRVCQQCVFKRVCPLLQFNMQYYSLTVVSTDVLVAGGVGGLLLLLLLFGCVTISAIMFHVLKNKRQPSCSRFV